MDKKQPVIYPEQKKVLDKEVFVFLAIFLAFFTFLGSQMGLAGLLHVECAVIAGNGKLHNMFLLS